MAETGYLMRYVAGYIIVFLRTAPHTHSVVSVPDPAGNLMALEGGVVVCLRRLGS